MPKLRLLNALIMTLVFNQVPFGIGEVEHVRLHPARCHGPYNLHTQHLKSLPLGFLGLGAQPPTPEWGLLWVYAGGLAVHGPTPHRLLEQSQIL